MNIIKKNEQIKPNIIFVKKNKKTNKKQTKKQLN